MRFQSGFSLVEVMIAGLVATSGLAGIASLLVVSLAQTSQARDRAVAQMLAQQVTELARIAPDLSECLAARACGHRAFTLARLEAWHQRVSQALPGGYGIICADGSHEDGNAAEPACDGRGSAVVKIFWRVPTGAHPNRRLVRRLP